MSPCNLRSATGEATRDIFFVADAASTRSGPGSVRNAGEQTCMGILDMKAISLWQPYASAVALKLKRNETRGRSTNIRGTIAIHAAKKCNRELEKLFDRLMSAGDFYHPVSGAGFFSFTMLPKGGVIAIVDLVEVVPSWVMVKKGRLSELEMKLGDYSDNRFVWRFENIRRLAQPYFIKGAQGWFNVPDDLERICGIV